MRSMRKYQLGRRVRWLGLGRLAFRTCSRYSSCRLDRKMPHRSTQETNTRLHQRTLNTGGEDSNGSAGIVAACSTGVLVTTDGNGVGACNGPG